MKWKEILQWLGSGIAVLLLLIISATYLIQKNTFLHRSLLTEMIQIGERSSGARITMRDYAIQWSPLRITLMGVVVRGRDLNVAKPFADLPHVEIGLAWGALLHRRVALTQLILDQPAVNLAFNQAGQSNLPTRSGSEAASANKLQISVQHAVVRNGDLRYNDLPRRIDADLAYFDLNINHDPATDRYSGNLEYQKGVLAIDGYRPLPHETQITFAATRSGVMVDKIRVGTEHSEFNAKGVVEGYFKSIVKVEYQVLVSAEDLREQLHVVPLSRGEIEIDGSLSYQSGVGPPLDALKTSGHFSSKILRASLSDIDLNFQSLRGDYSMKDGNLNVTNARADTMPGFVRAEFSAEHLTATPRYQLSIAAESLSLRQAERIVGAKIGPSHGTVHLRASARWASSLQTLIAHADVGISALIDPGQYSAASANAAPLPVNGDLHFTYDAPRGTLAVTNSSLSSNRTSLVAEGTISDHSELSLRARTSDLHEVDLLAIAAQGILSSTVRELPRPSQTLELGGRAAINARVQGRLEDPRITGYLQADTLEIGKARWPHVEADFDLTASSALLQNGQAQTSNRGLLNFALAIRMHHWSYAANEPISVQVQASQIPVSDFEQLTGWSSMVSGTFSGNLSVRGTIDNPAGEGALELRNGSLWGEPVRTVDAQLSAANGTLFANFRVGASAGNVNGGGEFRITDGHYQVSISHSALSLNHIQYLTSRGYGIAGTLGIDVQGEGTLRAPLFDVVLNGEELALRNTDFGSATARVHVADQQATFVVTSSIAGRQISINGNAGLATPYSVHAGFEIHLLEFESLLAAFVPSARNQLRGNAEARGQIDGPLANPHEVKASGELSELTLAYHDLTLATPSPVSLNYANDLLTISRAELKGTGTDFKFGGTLPLRGSAPLDISTSGLIDLRSFALLGGNTQSSGTVKIDMTAKGVLKQPQLGGSIEVAKASFASEVAPVGVANVNSRIAIANNRLNIENFSGQIGGGNLSMTGFVGYSPASFSLQVKGKSIRAQYPEATRAQLDTDLTLIGTPASSMLKGRVTIDDLSFRRDFDLANFIGQFSSSGPPVSSGWERNTRLDVTVASSQDLSLSSSKLSLQGSADLHVTGTLANPVVLGRSILSGGELFFVGNRYQVQSGTIVFANPIRTEPTFNLFVTTTVQQYDITLNFVGSLDRLRTNYTSDPALPTVDIINLLAFGKTVAGSTPTAAPTLMGAQSVIANGLASQVSNRIEELTGISQLQIDPSLGGNNGNAGSRVTVVQRVTGDILVTFSTYLNSTQNVDVQVKYQTKGRMSFSFNRDENGGYAIETKIRKTF